MLRERLGTSRYSFFEKLKSIDYFLIFIVICIGAISVFAIYSTENGNFSYLPTVICVTHLEYFRILFESYPGNILRTIPVEKNNFRSLQESLRLHCQRMKISDHLYYKVFYDLKKQITKRLLYDVFRKFSVSGHVPQIINIIMGYCFEN